MRRGKERFALSPPSRIGLQDKVARHPLPWCRGAVLDQDLQFRGERAAGVGLDQGIAAGGQNADLARLGGNRPFWAAFLR